jgi:regulator of protease activity HflC (stomatin/prohibitin superfamily)
MADEATATNDATEVETPDATEQPRPKDDVPPEVKAALRKANKEAETLRLKLQEFEDRDKSEAQKLAERADAAEKRAADLETRALRLEVAAAKGLTPAQAKRLVGSTREELESDADELLETFKPAVSDDETQMVPSLDLGTRGGAPMPLNGDPLEKALRRKLGIS